MLTNEQIDHLYAFCHKHSVRYYDVQIELVDHLANAIEDKMKAHPFLSFEDALAQVHKSFGVRGFAPVVAEKQKAVDRQNRKLLWSLFKQQFRWPKILLSMTIFAVCYSLLQLPSKLFFILPAIGCFLVITTIMLVIGHRLHRMEKRSGKEFLLLQFRNMLGFAFIPLNFFNIINIFRPGDESGSMPMSMAGQLTICIMITLFVVIAVATCQAFRHIEKELRRTYPSVFLAA
jgi:hypothetical protein